MGRKTVVSLLFSLSLVWAFWAPASAADGGLKKLAEGVYARVDIKGATPKNSFGANAGVIVGEDGILVVDTLTSAKEAAKLIADIRAVSGRPVRYVVDTHAHIDHAYGNSEFRKLGAVIVAHANARKSMEENGEAVLKGAKGYGLSDEDMEGTKVCVPDIGFTGGMEIDLGGRKVRLIHLGPAHTDGDTMVYLPAERILFAGDVLFTGYHPYLAEGDIPGWVNTLDTIKKMDAAAIVPGHGPVSGMKDLDAMKAYLLAFDKKATELCAASKDIGHIYSEMKKSLPERAELDMLIRANIQYRYLQK